jgi:hypothetical protein
MAKTARYLTSSYACSVSSTKRQIGAVRYEETER